MHLSNKTSTVLNRIFCVISMIFLGLVLPINSWAMDEDIPPRALQLRISQNNPPMAKQSFVNRIYLAPILHRLNKEIVALEQEDSVQPTQVYVNVALPRRSLLSSLLRKSCIFPHRNVPVQICKHVEEICKRFEEEDKAAEIKEELWQKKNKKQKNNQSLAEIKEELWQNKAKKQQYSYPASRKREGYKGKKDVRPPIPQKVSKFYLKK